MLKIHNSGIPTEEAITTLKKWLEVKADVNAADHLGDTVLHKLCSVFPTSSNSLASFQHGMLRIKCGYTHLD